jgi:hypothetical protein
MSYFVRLETQSCCDGLGFALLLLHRGSCHTCRLGCCHTPVFASWQPSRPLLLVIHTHIPSRQGVFIAVKPPAAYTISRFAAVGLPFPSLSLTRFSLPSFPRSLMVKGSGGGISRNVSPSLRLLGGEEGGEPIFSDWPEEWRPPCIPPVEGEEDKGQETSIQKGWRRGHMESSGLNA